MPGQAGAATTLYTNTTRVGWIIAGSLAGVVAEIWSYHAVFWIALAMGVVTQACLWRIRDGHCPARAGQCRLMIMIESMQPARPADVSAMRRHPCRQCYSAVALYD